MKTTEDLLKEIVSDGSKPPVKLNDDNMLLSITQEEIEADFSNPVFGEEIAIDLQKVFL